MNDQIFFNNIGNMTITDIMNYNVNQVPKQFKFPKTTNIDKWAQYLGRNISSHEASILKNFKGEKNMNEMLEELYEKCEEKNLFIPILSGLTGDCFFESLNYHGIGHDIESLRKSLACLMYLYKDVKNLFPTGNISLKEMFDMTEQFIVMKRDNNNNDSLIKYTYNVMCQDLTNMTSFTKLPTQIIMMLISLIFHVEIIVISYNTDFEMIINAYLDENTGQIKSNYPLRKIYLGKLGDELHYVPLKVIENGDNTDLPIYRDAKSMFFKWSKYIEKLFYKRYLINNWYINNEIQKALYDTKINLEVDEYSNEYSDEYSE